MGGGGAPRVGTGVAGTGAGALRALRGDPRETKKSGAGDLAKLRWKNLGRGPTDQPFSRSCSAFWERRVVA